MVLDLVPLRFLDNKSLISLVSLVLDINGFITVNMLHIKM